MSAECWPSIARYIEGVSVGRVLAEHCLTLPEGVSVGRALAEHFSHNSCLNIAKITKYIAYSSSIIYCSRLDTRLGDIVKVTYLAGITANQLFLPRPTVEDIELPQ
jgi:hypothetical protein